MLGSFALLAHWRDCAQRPQRDVVWVGMRMYVRAAGWCCSGMVTLTSEHSGRWGVSSSRATAFVTAQIRVLDALRRAWMMLHLDLDCCDTVSLPDLGHQRSRSARTSGLPFNALDSLNALVHRVCQGLSYLRFWPTNAIHGGAISRYRNCRTSC